MQDKHESQHLTKVKSNTLHTALVNRKIQTLKTLDSSPLKTLLFGLFEIGLSDKEWWNLEFQLGYGHKGAFKQQQSVSSLSPNEALDFVSSLELIINITRGKGWV